MGGNGYRVNKEGGGAAAKPNGPITTLLTSTTKSKNGLISEMASKESVLQMKADTAAWRKSLNEYQREAINSYMNHGYSEINTKLRAGVAMDSEKMPLEAYDMQEALLSGRTGSKAIVYRGVEGSMSTKNAALLNGKEVVERGFSSTSMDFKTGYQFTGPAEKGQLHVVREITVPKGSRAGYVSGSEKELILPANARFQHTGYEVVRYKDSAMGTSENVLVLKMTYLGPKGVRGRPRKAK